MLPPLIRGEIQAATPIEMTKFAGTYIATNSKVTVTEFRNAESEKACAKLSNPITDGVPCNGQAVNATAREPIIGISVNNAKPPSVGARNRAAARPSLRELCRRSARGLANSGALISCQQQPGRFAGTEVRQRYH